MRDDRVSIRIDAEDRTRSAIAQAKAGMRDYEKEIEGVQKTMRSFGAMTFGAVSFAALGTGVKAVVDTVIEVDKLRNTLAQGVGVEKVASEMEYLSAFSKKFGLDLTAAGAAYGSFTAAARGTAIEGEEARRAFEAVSKASTTLGLSADETKGALLALQQMISKGKVQAEELRGQLGERLPGAFQIAARAMGMTTQELDKLMSTGGLLADDFLPRFSRQLETEFAAGAERASESMQATVNRLSTSWTELKRTLVEGPVGEGTATVIGNLTNRLEQLKAGIEGVRASGNPFDFIKSADAENYRQRARAAGGERSGQIIGVSDYIDEVIASTAAMDAARKKAESAAGADLDKFMKSYETSGEKAERIGAEIRKMGTAAGKSETEIAALITKATTEKKTGNSAIQKASDELTQLRDKLAEMKLSDREFEFGKFVRIGGSAAQNAQADAILREIEARKDSIRVAEEEAAAFDKLDQARNDANKAVEESIKTLREQGEEAKAQLDLANQSETAVKVKLQLMEAERAGVNGLVADWQAYVGMVEKVNKDQRLGSLISNNPSRQYAQLAEDMELLEGRFRETGDLVEYAFGAQQARKLGGFKDELEKATDYSSQFVMTFTSGFEEGIFSSQKFSDSLKDLIVDLAKLTLRMQLLEPMFRAFAGGMVGGGTWWSSLAGLFGGGESNGAADSVMTGGGFGAGYDASSMFATKSTGAAVVINSTNNFAMGDMVRRGEFDEWTKRSDERTKAVVASAYDRGELSN